MMRLKKLRNRVAETPDTENIQAYRVKGEALTGVQEHGLSAPWRRSPRVSRSAPWARSLRQQAKIGLGAAMPNAVGTPHVVDGSWDPVQRHAVSQAIAGIEKQKDEDQAAILVAMA